MREVLPELLAWWRAGETVGVGTVVATFRSAPRPPGASMLVGPDETAVGSVSGGCVEGAVYELGQEVVASGVPVLTRYGISDDDAFAVGLTCGGILDVYVEKISRETFPELEELAADLDEGRPVAVATVIEHPDPDVARAARDHPPRLRRDDRQHRQCARRRRRARRRDGAARERHERHAVLRSRRRTPRRGHAGVRVGVRPEAADAGLRCDRLRRRGRPGRQLPRLPRDRLRRPAGLRHQHPVPRGRRGGRRVAPPLPGEAARRRRRWTRGPSSPCSPTTRSSTSPCSRWRCACPRWPTSAPWGRGAPTRTARSDCARPG